MTYFGGHSSETSQSGEESAMDQKSDIVVKRVDEQGKKLCNMNASTYGSCHASKENEDICNLVCDDIMGLLQNKKEKSTIKNGEIVNNECSRQLLGVKVSHISVGSATLKDDCNTREQCRLIESQLEKNDKALSCSDISQTSVEVDSCISDVKVKSSALILEKHATDECYSQVNGLGSTLSHEVATINSESKSMPEIKYTPNDMDRGSDITDRSIDRGLSNEIEVINKTENELDNSTASDESGENCHGNLAHLGRSLDSPSYDDEKNEKRLADISCASRNDSFSLSDKFDNQGCNDGLCSGDLSYSHQNESQYSTSDRLAPEDLLSNVVYSEENADNKISNLVHVKIDNKEQLGDMEVDSNQGPTLVDESSNITNSSLNSVITQNMVDEEERYETEDKAETEKQRMKAKIA